LGGEQVVVEQVVGKVTSVGPASYPILTKSNYNQLSLLMKIKLEARNSWGAIEPGDAEFQVNRMALDAICSTVPSEIIAVLGANDTAMEAWESIKIMHIGDGCIRQATMQKLRCEYETFTFYNGEGIVDFAMQLAEIMNQLATLGDPGPDDKVVLKYPRISRPRYKLLVLSIETLLDISTQLIEGVTGRLNVAEDDPTDSSVAVG
jgi:hypothetical protein